MYMYIVHAGEKGEGKTTCKPLHYEGTPIHRIVKGFIIQGGDFSEGKTVVMTLQSCTRVC